MLISEFPFVIPEGYHHSYLHQLNLQSRWELGTICLFVAKETKLRKQRLYRAGLLLCLRNNRGEGKSECGHNETNKNGNFISLKNITAYNCKLHWITGSLQVTIWFKRNSIKMSWVEDFTIPYYECRRRSKKF